MTLTRPRRPRGRWWPRPAGGLADGERLAWPCTARKARVASGSRIFVEGRHDAELVEKVWGDDLRIEGVVVEMLDGVDDLEAVIRDFGPGPGRRMGVLVDHLVPGTKECRVVAGAAPPAVCRARADPGAPLRGRVAVGASRSDSAWSAWPVIPRGQSWKHGICAHLGWPHDSQADIARAWKRILGTVRTYADLEPTLLARVEELIDFVQQDPPPRVRLTFALTPP